MATAGALAPMGPAKPVSGRELPAGSCSCICGAAVSADGIRGDGIGNCAVTRPEKQRHTHAKNVQLRAMGSFPKSSA